MRINTNTATLILASAAILALAPPSIGQTKSAPAKPEAVSMLTKGNEEAIRKTVMGFEQAWNTHDMELLASLFREDAEFINVVGMHWHRRDAIVAAHKAFHETIFKTTQMKFNAIEIRSIGPEHAIAVGDLTLDSFTTPNGEVVPKALNRETFVLIKGAEGWRIAHGHNVRVDQEAVKHDPVNSPK